MNISELAYKYADKITDDKKKKRLAELVLASVKFDDESLGAKFLSEEKIIQEICSILPGAIINSTRNDLNKLSREEILIFAGKLRDFTSAISSEKDKFPCYIKNKIKEERIAGFHNEILEIVKRIRENLGTEDSAKFQAFNKFKSNLIKIQNSKDKFEALSHIARSHSQIPSLRKVFVYLAEKIIMPHIWDHSKNLILLVWIYVEATKNNWNHINGSSKPARLTSYKEEFKSNIHRFKKFNHSLVLINSKDELYEKIALLAKSLKYSEEAGIIKVVNYWTYLVTQEDIEDFKNYIFKEIKLAEAESISF